MFITIILDCSYSSVTALELRVLVNRNRMNKKKTVWKISYYIQYNINMKH
jgi:hypothetical protein